MGFSTFFPRSGSIVLVFQLVCSVAPCAKPFALVGMRVVCDGVWSTMRRRKTTLHWCGCVAAVFLAIYFSHCNGVCVAVKGAFVAHACVRSRLQWKQYLCGPRPQSLVRLHAGAGEDSTAGKFYQLGGADANPKVVPPTFGPFGVIVGGWTDDELEYVVAPTLEEEAAAGDSSSDDTLSIPVPIRVLAQTDLDKPLKDILANLQEMDAVMPEEGQDAKLERPMLLFSGWDPERMISAVRRFRGLVGLRRIRNDPMAAMAVPRAMNKKLSVLAEEILGDYEENMKK